MWLCLTCTMLVDMTDMVMSFCLNSISHCLALLSKTMCHWTLLRVSSRAKTLRTKLLNAELSVNWLLAIVLICCFGGRMPTSFQRTLQSGAWLTMVQSCTIVACFYATICATIYSTVLWHSFMRQFWKSSDKFIRHFMRHFSRRFWLVHLIQQSDPTEEFGIWTTVHDICRIKCRMFLHDNLCDNL